MYIRINIRSGIMVEFHSEMTLSLENAQYSERLFFRNDTAEKSKAECHSGMTLLLISLENITLQESKVEKLPCPCTRGRV